ncbi:MAG: tetratricopeptide repeat protein [Terracidiphilus sp.]|jgi:TPR repeat protein
MKNGLTKVGCSIIASLTILAIIEGIDFVRWLVFDGSKPLFFDWKAGLCILAALWIMPKIGDWFERREKRFQDMADRVQDTAAKVQDVVTRVEEMAVIVRDIDTRLEAFYKWGSPLTTGDDVESDAQEYEGLDDETKTKITEYTKSIENGDVSLRYNLGVIYWNLAMAHYNTHGLSGYRKAVHWLRKAAEQNYDCESTLADAYIELQDFDKAMFWYHRSVKRGGNLIWIPERKIGDMYAEGQGVSKNHAEAVRWWRRAADHGSTWAHHTLGELYAEGADGVKKDAAEAYFHLYIAASDRSEHGPHKYYDELRDKVEKELDEYAIAREKQRADEWLAADKARNKRKVTPLPLPQ